MTTDLETQLAVVTTKSLPDGWAMMVDPVVLTKLAQLMSQDDGVEKVRQYMREHPGAVVLFTGVRAEVLL